MFCWLTWLRCLGVWKFCGLMEEVSEAMATGIKIVLAVRVNSLPVVFSRAGGGPTS